MRSIFWRAVSWLGALQPLAEMLHRLLAKATPPLSPSPDQRHNVFRVSRWQVSRLIATGATTLGTWSAVSRLYSATAYGKLLLLKIGLLLPLLGIGAIISSVAQPRIVELFTDQPGQSPFHCGNSREILPSKCWSRRDIADVGYLGGPPPARPCQPDWPFSFSRYDCSVLDQAPKASAEVQRA